MKINNVELEDLDMFDLDTAAKVENAINILDEKENETIVEELSLAEIIKQKCTLIFDFFNDIWGEDTDKKVFGRKVNYKECYKAFAQVLEKLEQSKHEMEDLTSKYSPNRAQRRAKK